VAVTIFQLSGLMPVPLTIAQAGTAAIAAVPGKGTMII
jgi:hypothetical protein